jgi:toxin YoeB
MTYQLNFSQQAISEIEFHKKAGNNAVLKKLFVLLNELNEHPFDGTGKPEQLKYSLTGMWSRRINQEHRLVYEVLNDIILIHSTKGHYL